MIKANCLVCARCGSPKEANTRRHCKPCFAEAMRILNAGAKAHAAVIRAKKKGLLPALDGSVPCVDCGRAAEQYEHRDYSKPLQVDPVCRCCNKRRGRAAA